MMINSLKIIPKSAIIIFPTSFTFKINPHLHCVSYIFARAEYVGSVGILNPPCAALCFITNTQIGFVCETRIIVNYTAIPMSPHDDM